METLTLDHSLVRDRVARLRDQETDRAGFRTALHELSLFLVYEAVRDFPGSQENVRTPLGTAPGFVIDCPPVLVPVLRAGLGMLNAATTLFPTAPVGFIGLRRNEETLQPESYLQTVPGDLTGRSVLVLDPMLATGGSLEHACREIKEGEPESITVVSVISAPEGVSRLAASGLANRLVTGVVDTGLDDRAFIVPGLGDAGDRQFGPP